MPTLNTILYVFIIYVCNFVPAMQLYCEVSPIFAKMQSQGDHKQKKSVKTTGCIPTWTGS